MKKFGILITVFLCSVFLYSTALAVPITNYTLNFSAASDLLAGANVSNLENVKEMGFQGGRTVVGFQDNDNSGGISIGDSFDDYFAINIGTFTSTDDNPLYSTGYGSDHQITLLGHLQGEQTTDNTYQINNIVDLGFYFDAGDNYTVSNTSDLDTYADGIEVETGSLIAGGGTNDAGILSGTFDLIVDIEDLLHNLHTDGEYFELDPDGNPFPMQLTFGLIDSNTNAQDPNFDVSPFETYFGFSADTDYDIVATALNDGSINKAVVPEPATMLLFGTGLLGFAGLYRHRRRKSS